MKALAEVAVPPAVVTVITPVLVPAATMAVTWVAPFTVKPAAAFPLNATALAPLKFAPVMVTAVPVDPDAGANAEMLGTGERCWEELEPPPPPQAASPIITTLSRTAPKGLANLAGKEPVHTAVVHNRFAVS